jgi:hypothetical protein
MLTIDQQKKGKMTKIAFYEHVFFIGYGQTGPYRMKPGYDVMIEAEAGLMYITGEENGTPVKVGVAVTGKVTIRLFSFFLVHFKKHAACK